MKRITRTTRFWLLAAVAAAAFAGTAYATIPGGDGTIHGCYAKSGGTLRVIDASVTSCKSGETALDWGQQGQPGPKGDPGVPGPAGPEGPPGAFPDRLPSGKTLRGTYIARGDAPGENGVGGDAISFGLTLATPPTAHVIRAGDAGDPNCPGTPVVPEAEPGHLCVYERSGSNVASLVHNLPLTSGVVLATSSAAAGFFLSDGAWAVTAP